MNIQKVQLKKDGAVSCSGNVLRFGYAKNSGIYRLQVTAADEWRGMDIRAVWHPPDGSTPPATLVAAGSLDVPASVTAQPGDGCITFEGSDGTRTVTSADLHYHVAANSGTEDGTAPEPGTPAWEAFVAEMKKAAGGTPGLTVSNGLLCAVWEE